MSNIYGQADAKELGRIQSILAACYRTNVTVPKRGSQYPAVVQAWDAVFKIGKKQRPEAGGEYQSYLTIHDNDELVGQLQPALAKLREELVNAGLLSEEEKEKTKGSSD